MALPPRIFLDSSVLFAAAASPTGASRAIIVLAELGLWQLVICQQVFIEVEQNLQTKAPLALPYFQQLQTTLKWEIVADPTLEQIRNCAKVIVLKDAPILAAAIQARPDRFVTLDMRDFGQPIVQKQLVSPIQKPADLLVELRQAIEKGINLPNTNF